MSFTVKPHFRARVHELVDELSDEDLASLWPLIKDVYCDTYMLKAIQTARRSPGDSLTCDEAIQFLSHS